jgi:DNA-binding XRE family transcriptional regulator
MSVQIDKQQTRIFFEKRTLFYFLDCHKTMDQMVKNSLKKIRESLLMSKSELAREANVSPITITRIEEGKPCRLETKRKILLALGTAFRTVKKSLVNKRANHVFWKKRPNNWP